MAAKPAGAKTPTEPEPPAKGDSIESPSAEERRAKRETARQERMAVARRKQREKRRRQVLIAGVLVLAVVGASVYGLTKGRNQRQSALAAAETAGCGDVIEAENEGREHIPLTQEYDDYKTSPPTSGPHYAQRVATWGSYNEEVPKTTLVHNLEHGGIVVHYKDQSPKMQDRISEFVDSYSDGVVANPNPSIDKPIILTAWTLMMTCEQFSEEAVAGFIQQNCNNAPEKLTTCQR